MGDSAFFFHIISSIYTTLTCLDSVVKQKVKQNQLQLMI
jgi:hypothetical protein